MSNIVPVSDLEKMAVAAAQSRMFGFKNKEEAMAIMLLCQAEGLHPGIAMRDYHVIQGRPTLKSDAMLARFQQNGGKVEWHTLSNEEVSATFSHPSGGSVKITWTFAEAKKIGLTGKDNWNKYPRAMLRARVVSEGVRTVYPGVVIGTYTPEEVQDMEPRGPSKAPQEPIIEDEIEETKGEYPVMLPGNPEPYTHCATPELWVGQFNELANRIIGSAKIKEDEKRYKLEKMLEANQHIIEVLGEELRNGLVI